MEIAKANIVRSEAGRDKGKLFYVLDVDGEYLLLADGKERKRGLSRKPKGSERKLNVVLKAFRPSMINFFSFSVFT